jgi:excisionase family DNA binding protein
MSGKPIKEGYLTTGEVAELIDVSRNTLVSWIHRGVIKDSTYRDGRGFRYWTPEDVERVKQHATAVHDYKNL